MARTRSGAGKKVGGKASGKARVLRSTSAVTSGGVSKTINIGGKASGKARVLRSTSAVTSGGVSKTINRKGSGGGRNAVCKRAVPKWQMPIGEFLTKAGSSKVSAAAGAPEIDMEITEVHAPTSAVCGSADSTVKDAAVSNTEEDKASIMEVDAGNTSITEGEAAVTSFEEGEAADTSVEEGEAADTSVEDDEAADNSIEEVAEKSMNGDKATDNEEVKKEVSAENGSMKNDIQGNGGKSKKEDREVSVMNENIANIEVDEIAPTKAKDVAKIPENMPDEMGASKDTE